MKLFLVTVIIAALSGCATGGDLWKATQETDSFSDVSTKMVTVGDFKRGSVLSTSSLRYYPFVGVFDGSLVVGIRSGGRIKVPTGTVQMRIDANQAWTISPEETPVMMTPAIAPAATYPMPSVAEVNIQQIQEAAMKTVQQSMSPYTVATGDKAKKIIAEMLVGKKLIYRTIGFNQAASTQGEVEIDDSFHRALLLIGVDPQILINR